MTKKILKKSHARIWTTVRQAVGLQESLLYLSATTYGIHTSAFHLYTLKLTLQIKIARPLSLHYVARTLVSSSD